MINSVWILTRKWKMGQFNIVAIGSSAGGLKALSTVLSGLSGDLPVAVLVVQHLEPRHKSLMAEILQRNCKMKVKEAEHGEDLNINAVYIAPPNKHMLANDGKIVLTSTAFVHFVRPSIDLLFESVAADFGDRSIGVILTGTGSDGSMGIRAIKERGGTTIASDEKTSEFFGMPQAAIATGAVDFILPLQDIAHAIEVLVRGE
ncbi:MAG: chemotaxis protein CheB [Candidatus Methanoperedens sp.]|nr:chemotaxis protein CheB [Candidatus Methanoperedens sp.]